MDSRVRYTAAVARAAEKLGWSLGLLAVRQRLHRLRHRQGRVGRADPQGVDTRPRALRFVPFGGRLNVRIHELRICSHNNAGPGIGVVAKKSLVSNIEITRNQFFFAIRKAMLAIAAPSFNASSETLCYQKAISLRQLSCRKPSREFSSRVRLELCP